MDYDQLLIFEPTFSGYSTKYGVTADRLQTIDDFGQLMGFLPIGKEEEAMAHYSHEDVKSKERYRLPMTV